MQNLLTHLPSKFAILFIGACIFLSSCDKDAVLDDNNLNPGTVLNTAENDTLMIAGFTSAQDAVSATNLGDTWIGQIEDSRFGLSKASIYTQIKLSQTGIDIGANAVLDSAFLYLNYGEVYGPGLEPTSIFAYQLLDDIDSIADYPADTTLNTGASIVASVGNYTIEEDGGVIKMPLTSTFANSLFSQIGTATFESNDNFLTYLRGLFITTDVGTDGMMELSMLNSETKMDLFYHSDDPNDSLYSFTIDNQSVWTSQYLQDVSGSDAELLIDNGNTDQEELFVIPFSGTKAIIDLPDLSFLSNVVINRAELTIYESDFNSAESAEFPALETLYVDLLIDGVNVSFTASGKEQVTVNGVQTNAYTFALTNYMQDYVEGINDYEMSISFHSTSSLNVSYPMGRVRLGGGNHPDLPINMKIIYTLPE